MSMCEFFEAQDEAQAELECPHGLRWGDDDCMNAAIAAQTGQHPDASFDPDGQ